MEEFLLQLILHAKHVQQEQLVMELKLSLVIQLKDIMQELILLEHIMFVQDVEVLMLHHI